MNIADRIFLLLETAKSILISVGVRLAAFNLKQIANLTCTDELDLYSIGEKKWRCFVVSRMRIPASIIWWG